MWWPQCGQTFRFAIRSRWKIICWQAGHWCQRFSGTSRRANSVRIFGRTNSVSQFMRAPARRARRRRVRAPGPAPCAPTVRLCRRFAAIVLHSAEPTTAASATRTASAACAGERTPKPTAIGRSVTRADARDRFGRVLGRRAARAGDAGDADVIDEAGTAIEHQRQALVVRGRRDQADDVDAVRGGLRHQHVGLLGGQVDHDQPIDAGRRRIGAEALGAIGQDRVQVAHQDDRRRVVLAAELAHHGQHVRRPSRRPSARACRPPGRSDRRPSDR